MTHTHTAHSAHNTCQILTLDLASNDAQYLSLVSARTQLQKIWFIKIPSPSLPSPLFLPSPLCIASFCPSLQDEWLTCQRNWLYLESIFLAPDIKRQLPAESKMFVQVDKSWREIMAKVKKLPNALNAATQPGR